MKKLILAFLMLAIVGTTQAQDAPADSSGKPPKTESQQGEKKENKKKENKKKDKKDQTETKCCPISVKDVSEKSLIPNEKLVSFLPIVLLTIIFLVLLKGLWTFDLKEALSTDHDSGDKTPSASRLIAFISGLSALAFSFGLFVFYTSVYIKTGCAPEIDTLTNALIALGIGVFPYSINKVAGAIERKK